MMMSSQAAVLAWATWTPAINTMTKYKSKKIQKKKTLERQLLAQLQSTKVQKYNSKKNTWAPPISTMTKYKNTKIQK